MLLGYFNLNKWTVGLSGAVLLLSAFHAHAAPEKRKVHPVYKALSELRKAQLDTPKENIKALEERFNNSKEPRDRLVAALALGVNHSESSPRLALQYLSNAELQARGNDPLMPIIKFHKAQAKFRAGSYESAIADIEDLLRRDIGKGWESQAFSILIESYYHIGAYEKLLASYNQFARRNSANAHQERLAQLAAEALEKRGFSPAIFQTLEELAAQYPMTETARWAFHRLIDYSCEYQNVGKVRYRFSEDFLVRLSRNAMLENGLRELILAIIEAPIYSGQNITILRGKDKMDFLIRARFYDDAIEFATQQLAQTSKSEQDVRAHLISDLSKAYSYRGDFVTAAKYITMMMEDHPAHASWLRAREKLAETLSKMQSYDAAADQFKILATRQGRKELGWFHFWNEVLAGKSDDAMHLLSTPDYVMPRDQRDSAALEYWNARLLEKSGKKEEAFVLYRDLLAKEGDSFYAIMILARYPQLGERDTRDVAVKEERDRSKGGPGSFAAKIFQPIDFPQLESRKPITELQVIGDLLRGGLTESARIQLRSLTWHNLDESETFAVAGQLAWMAKDYQPANRVALRPNSALRRRPNNWWALTEHQQQFGGEWKVYFPLAFDEITSKVVAPAKVDKFLVLSIMRAESRYNMEAKSPVGARGLMQLMPSTAMKIADLIRDYDFELVDLTKPQVNISYGAFYLGKLLNYYGNNVFLTIAAYNAGPIAVNRWLSSCQKCDVDEFVDSIPFRETRRYVKEVSRYLANYEQIYQRKSGLLEMKALPKELPSEEMF